MERQALTIYSDASNLAVIEVPGRRFPGSVVQGDSLKLLCDLANSIHQEAIKTSIQKLISDTGELMDLLQARLQHYEVTLRHYGIDLPYPEQTQE